MWADAVENAGTFYPPDVIKSYENGAQAPVDGRRGALPPGGPPAGPPGDHRAAARRRSDMKNKEDFWDVVEVVPGAPLMQKPDAFGCKLGDYT